MIQSLLASLGFVIWRLLAATGRSVWTLMRPGFRFVSSLLVLAATIALVIDVTHWQIGAPGPTFQSLEDHIRSAAPATLYGIGLALGSTFHPFVWDPILRSLLSFPAWMTLLLLAGLLGYAARERRQVSIFIN